MMTSRRPSPPPVSVPDLAASPATFSTTEEVRWSLAFSSMVGQSMSLASAWAAEVLPTPGLPWRMAASPWSSHVSAHSFSASRALLFPRSSESEVGRYFSVQSVIESR